MKARKSFGRRRISAIYSLRGKRSLFTGKSTVLSFVFALLFLCAGCSGEKKKQPPKTHPELLLSLTEDAEKNDYKNMLPKIARLQAIDPACSFIGELENTTKMNLLVKEINFLTAKGSFSEAYKKINNYEKLNGPSQASGKVKDHLSLLMRLEKTVKSLSAPRNSVQFQQNIILLDSLKKMLKFSPALRNFTEKKRSELARFKAAEFGNTCFGLWSDALSMKSGNDPAYPVLAAILESIRDDFPVMYMLNKSESTQQSSYNY